MSTLSRIINRISKKKKKNRSRSEEILKIVLL